MAEIKSHVSIIEQAKKMFKSIRPEHFTNFGHCEECLEHDQTLLKWDIDTIGIPELGNPGWDPMCFCSFEGKKYYMPALIRLSLETIYTEFYFSQLLFHLEHNGLNNEFYQNCSYEQRKFIADYLSYMFDNYSKEISLNCCENEFFRTLEIWSMNII